MPQPKRSIYCLGCCFGNPIYISFSMGKDRKRSNNAKPREKISISLCDRSFYFLLPIDTYWASQKNVASTPWYMLEQGSRKTNVLCGLIAACLYVALKRRFLNSAMYRRWNMWNLHWTEFLTPLPPMPPCLVIRAAGDEARTFLMFGQIL